MQHDDFLRLKKKLSLNFWTLRIFFILTNLLSVGIVWAQDEKNPNDSFLIGNHKQLLEDITKERTNAQSPVLNIANIIKKSLVSLSLDQAITEKNIPIILQATISHPDWSSAEAAIDYAKSYSDEAASALKPQISGGVDYGKRAYGQNPITNGGALNYTSTASQISLKQLLYDGSSRKDYWLSTDKKAKAQEFRSEIQKSEVALKLIEAAMNKQRYEIQRLWVSTFEDQRKETAKKILRRFEIGAGTIYDIARSDMKVSESRLTLQQIYSELENSIASLREYNLPEDFVLPNVAENLNQLKIDIDALVDQNPATKEAVLFAEAAQLEYNSSISRSGPTINFELNRTDKAFNGTGNPSADFSKLVTLTYNFYSGGAESARVAQSASKLNQVKNDLDSRKRNLRNIINKSIQDAMTIFSSIDIRRSAVESSAASFSANFKLFEINRGSLIDLQRNEDELYDKVRQLIDSQFDSTIYFYRYLHVANKLTPLLYKNFKIAPAELKPFL